MALPLTTAQRTDLRADLGDTGPTGQFFTDADLDRFWQRADGDYDRTLLLAFGPLRAEAGKRVNYAVGPDREDAAQVFEHLTILAGEVEARVAARQELAGDTAVAGGTVAVPIAWVF